MQVLAARDTGQFVARRDLAAVGEFLLLVLVLAALFWQFQGLRAGAADAPDDDRYRLDQALQTAPLIGYGQAQVATLCHTASLPPRLRWRWDSACAGTRADQAGALDALPAALQADQAALQQAIVAGAAERLSRVAPLAKSLAEGVLPDAEQSLLADTARELNVYRSRYQLGADPGAGSLTLACAWAESVADFKRADSEA